MPGIELLASNAIIVIAIDDQFGYNRLSANGGDLASTWVAKPEVHVKHSTACKTY